MSNPLDPLDPPLDPPSIELTARILVPDDGVARTVFPFALPDVDVPRIVAAMCYLQGFDPATDGDPTEFAKKEIIRYVTEMTLSVERSQIEAEWLATRPEPPPLGDIV